MSRCSLCVYGCCRSWLIRVFFFCRSRMKLTERETPCESAFLKLSATTRSCRFCSQRTMSSNGWHSCVQTCKAPALQLLVRARPSHPSPPLRSAHPCTQGDMASLEECTWTEAAWVCQWVRAHSSCQDQRRTISRNSCAARSNHRFDLFL